MLRTQQTGFPRVGLHLFKGAPGVPSILLGLGSRKDGVRVEALFRGCETRIHLCEDHKADRLVAAVARSTRCPDTLLGFFVNICIVMYVFNEKS